MTAPENPAPPDPDRPLAAGLAPPSDGPSAYELWRAEAQASLGDGSLEDLISTTADGLEIAPLYTAEHEVEDPAPGLWALRRCSRVARPEEGWDLRQRHADPDLEAARSAMLEDLAAGVRSLELRFDEAARHALDPLADTGSSSLAMAGLPIHDRWDLAEAIRGVRLDLAPVSLEAEASFYAAAALLFAHLRSAELDLSTTGCRLGADPVAVLARRGFLPQGIDRALLEAAELARYCSEHAPAVHALRVDCAPWSDAGAGEALEIGLALSTSLVYLRAMLTAGLPLETAARQITFRFSLGTDLFSSIAKLRAFRVAWGRVLHECGVEPGLAASASLEVETARRVLTRLDPWGNLLRVTASTFAGVLGGADVVLAPAFDAELGLPSELGRRLARNTQHVLADESALHRVRDPAGGSWYVEHLTRDLLVAAWAEMQRIEGLGGVIAALQDGALHERLAALAEARAARVESGSRPLIGVSEFGATEPEVLPDRPHRDHAALRSAARERLLERRVARGVAPPRGDGFAGAIAAAGLGATLSELASPAAADALHVVPLPLRRLAEPWERESASAGGGEG